VGESLHQAFPISGRSQDLLREKVYAEGIVKAITFKAILTKVHGQLKGVVESILLIGHSRAGAEQALRDLIDPDAIDSGLI
jgi:phage anti-repressor protein